MESIELNRLTTRIRDLCGENPFGEKWLIAPSRRVGLQWLDAVTRSGQPVLNVRVKTLQSVALDVVTPEMDRQGSTFLRGVRAEVLVDSIFGRLKKGDRGYLLGLEPSPGLMRTLLNTIRDLRLSGLKASGLDPEDFEVDAKGRELKTILAEYEKRLRGESLVDYADILRMATAEVEGQSPLVPEGTLLLVPEQIERELWDLEQAFLAAFKPESRVILAEDDPRDPVEEAVTDATLLRWISSPLDAPPPQEDGTARLYRSVGEVNEVREIFRRCAENAIPFDQVEILHTDAETYVPLIFELAWRLNPDESESIPVTFGEGIPTRYSRPGRALSAWISWVRDDYPQSFLVRMIQDGLLKIERADEVDFSFAGLGAMLRTVPVGSGRDRYIPALDREIQALKNQKDHLDPAEDIDKRRSGLVRRIDGLKAVRLLAEELIQHSPDSQSGQRAILEHAAWFLQSRARCCSQYDEYSRARFLKEIRELADCLGEDSDTAGLNVGNWLLDLPLSSVVGGQGPRPGCLYVAPVHSGGHSGRKHTFILGLDDTRFPGSGFQDPLLLDRERSVVSDTLPTSANLLGEKVVDFTRMLVGLRGSVTLSYCCQSLEDDREMFPSPVVLLAYRVLSGNHDGNQDDLLKWLPDRASSAPTSSLRCIDPTEWWLWRTCGDEGVSNPEQAISDNFPHLNRGFQARRSRKSDLFTEYDGYVPAAGKDHDPVKPDGPVLSASRMELLASCPLAYFFQYILRIERPEEYEIDARVWLDPLQKGTLLHAVFREFMSLLIEKNRLPDFNRDWPLLNELLENEIAECRAEFPPANDEVFGVTVRELSQTARIFLQEEEDFCRNSKPVYLEMSIGMPPEGKGTALDTPDPLDITLANGMTLRARGRIDRIDELPVAVGGGFTIWDYKTGSSWGYDRNDPFRQGRRIQTYLYTVLAEKRLRQKLSNSINVEEFGYFFPSTREHGERIQWSRKQLAKGGHIIERLVQLMSNGCYPFTDNPQDVRFSDYRAAFGGTESAAAAMKMKLENMDNSMLTPFQELRDYRQVEED